MKKCSIYEKIKIWAERTPGMSWCQHCGKTWDFVEYVPIQYSAKLPDKEGKTRIWKNKFA